MAIFSSEAPDFLSQLLTTPGGPSPTVPEPAINPFAGIPSSYFTPGTSPDGSVTPPIDTEAFLANLMRGSAVPSVDMNNVLRSLGRPEQPVAMPTAPPQSATPPPGFPSPGTAAGSGSTTGGTPGAGTPGAGMDPAVANILRGLNPTSGASATINGTAYTATPTGWAPTASLPPQNTGAAGQPDFLGFQPNFQTFAMPTFATDGSGALTGTRPMEQTYQYLDQASADRLAQLLGASVYSEPSTAPNRTAPAELSLQFGNGMRMNAGLVARMFQTDPQNAMRRLQAELNYTPGNAVASTSSAYAPVGTRPSPQALNANQGALSTAPRINGGENNVTVPQASYYTGQQSQGNPAGYSNPLQNPTDFDAFGRAQAAARPPALLNNSGSRTNNYYTGLY